MFKGFISTLITVISVSAQSDFSSQIIIAENRSSARLNIKEKGAMGPLAEYYDSIKIADEVIKNSMRTKSYIHPTLRLVVKCVRFVDAKEITETTECNFVLYASNGSNGVLTQIESNSETQFAQMTLAPNLASEMKGLFPSDNKGHINFNFPMANDVNFQVKSEFPGEMVIQFSRQLTPAQN